MLKKFNLFALVLFGAFFAFTVNAVPKISGEPIIVQHLGKLEWPQEDPTTSPYLTQLSANDINDLHGTVSCDLIISTPGNYHMALKDAMKGRPDLGHKGLQAQLQEMGVTVCWSTSPPVGPDQIKAEDLQFKNIHLHGRPVLAMGPGAVMKKMIADKQVIESTSKPFMRNHGNVILVRQDMADKIHNVCDLGGKVRVVTPNPKLEPGSFSNFSGTIFNVAEKNDFGCDANILFNSIFSQNLNDYDLSKFDNPYDIVGVLSVFGIDARKGYKRMKKAPRWIASSRIMHRDIPYALCHNEADAGVIFYHQAKYLKREMAATGCQLAIVPLGGSEAEPKPLEGNKVGTLFIAKVSGNFPTKVQKARDLIYDFITDSPVWGKILAEHGMTYPTPN